MTTLWKPNAGPQTKFLASPAHEALYGGAAGGGKALHIDTPLPTPTGWTTMDAVRVDDWLLDEAGQPCQVLATSAIMLDHDVFEVIFDDGSNIMADADHLWLTFDIAARQALTRRTAKYRKRRCLSRPTRGTGRRPDLAEWNRQHRPQPKQLPTGEVVSTLNVLQSLRVRNRTNHSIAVARALELPERDLPIDPYVLGAWLGDGSSYGNGFTTADQEILQQVKAAGYEVTSRSGPYEYGILGLFHPLRVMGLLRNKHIPASYLRASIKQRLALLAGLMDTDGTATQRGACVFCTTSQRLASGAWELLQTLGIKCAIRTTRAKLNGKDCGEQYRIKFTTAMPVFRLSRKHERQVEKERGTQGWRYIVDVRKVQSVPVKCVAVSSPSHLYLAGPSMIPTHNSDALLAEALRQVANSAYRAVILRRTFPELEQSGGLIDRSKELYPALDGNYSETRHRWDFPAGTQVNFGHMQREDDKYKYQGAQAAYVAFDELTHFTETQYLYLFSRCRAPAGSGLRCYVRAATNPGGPGHEWVKRRWGAWLDKQHPRPAKAGELRYYARIEGQDVEVERGHPEARSRTFIPAFVADNPYLAGTDYEKNLQLLPLVERKRLLEGDWDIMPGRGLVFRREWFEIVEAAPADAQRARFWDLAATEKEAKGSDPDYTVGARWARAQNGLYYIEHVGRIRSRWQGIKALMAQLAQIDGPAVAIGVEQEPGASGKALSAEIVQHLAGYNVRGIPARGDKLVRAQAWSAQAEAGNVKIVNGPWVDALLDELEWFPEGAHDDQVDACSGAFAMLAGAGWHGWWSGTTDEESKEFVDSGGEVTRPPLRKRIEMGER